MRHLQIRNADRKPPRAHTTHIIRIIGGDPRRAILVWPDSMEILLDSRKLLTANTNRNVVVRRDDQRCPMQPDGCLLSKKFLEN